jgi:hypothetical protein
VRNQLKRIPLLPVYEIVSFAIQIPSYMLTQLCCIKGQATRDRGGLGADPPRRGTSTNQEHEKGKWCEFHLGILIKENTIRGVLGGTVPLITTMGPGMHR